MATFEECNASPELSAASEGLPGLFAGMGVEILCRVQYESTKTWGIASALSVINTIGIQCPPETEAKLETYYDAMQISSALKFKRIEGVDRCKFAGSSNHATGRKLANIKVKEYPKYLIFYYYRDLPTFEKWNTSPECVVVRESWLNVSKETGASILWQAQYEPMRTWPGKWGFVQGNKLISG